MVFIWGVNRFFVIEIAAFGHMKKDEDILKTVFLFQGINRYGLFPIPQFCQTDALSFF